MSGPVVQTEYGQVRGLQREGVEVFVEIPYGGTTAGDNRFRAPLPPEPWREIRPATTWVNRAPQNPDPSIGRTPHQWFTVLGEHYAPGMSEDCLTLNIWTPSSSDGRRRPVLVWFHGGGYVVGHATCDQTDGENFARLHDVVFVSVSHRLGVFGFLNLADLGGPEFSGSGCCGLLDLVASLKWVQANIASFGGDGENVTIIGESGGGAKVSDLLVMPAAQGLFHKAVCESGVASRGVLPGESVAYAEQLIKELGGAPHDVKVLIDASVEELLDTQSKVDRQLAVPPRMAPVVDGVLLVDKPGSLWGTGRGANVPMVVGSCRDEVSIFGEVDHNVDIALPASFEGGGKDQPPMLASKAGFSELAKAIGSDIGAAVRARRSEYPNEKEEAVVVALLSDLLFRRPAIKLAEARAKYGQAATFVYQINWSSPLLPELGACHSIGVSLFFRNEERVACARGDVSASSLARRMANALASFMRDGDPNCEGLPYWGAYSPDKRQVMLFEEPPVVEVDPQGALRQAWDEIQPDFPLV